MNLTISILTHFPEGSFFISKNGTRYKWYQSKPEQAIYIPKSNKSLAEQLAYKKYLTRLIEDFQHELSALNYYLNHHIPGKADALLEHPEYHRLISPFFQPASEELTNWRNASYEKNPYHPEKLIHKTISGYTVRSKSEVLIDMVLCKHRLPYRYECALQLGNSTIYPDFTIRHPQTGEFFYYEHFGRMDDPEYIHKACTKIERYTVNGIIPSINLLTTFETLEHPLSVETVEKLVRDYFL